MANKIFIFVPAFGQTITATTFLTTHALQQHLGSKGIGGGVSTLSFPDIAELRSMALTIWYDTMPDVGYLLFIDADMGFAPEIVTDMLLFDEALIGTIYPQRKMPLSWAGSGTGQPTTERRGNFMHVEGVGMGCTLIRRDLVTKMLEQMPELIDTRLQLHPAGDTLRQAGTNRLIRCFEKLDLPERGLVSEDLSFCIRAARCGIKTWAAIAYKISHVGPFDYSGRYLDMIETQQAQTAQPIIGAQAIVQPSTLPGPLPVTVGGTAISEPLKVIGDVPAAAPIITDSAAAVAADQEVQGFVVTEQSATGPKRTRKVPPRTVIAARKRNGSGRHARA